MEILGLAFVHWLHVLMGVSWFGTIIFTRSVLFPQLKTLPPETESAVLKAIQGGRARNITIVTSWGTIVLGIVRGVAGGALADPTSAYGLTFLASAVIGIAMVLWLWTPWLKTLFWRRVYVACFPVIFTLMVAMRFGY